MKKFASEKKWICILSAIVLAVLLAIVVKLIVNGTDKSEAFFNLSERDVLLEIGESKKVELVSEKSGVKTSKASVSWKSSKSSVATVEDGTVVAVAGGETTVTAVVEYKGKQYSTSCVVTVKSDENAYSAYKIRWFTQKQDRTGYEIVEESFERLVGSSVELTTTDAKRNLPDNYVLNAEKSNFTGTVKESKAGCILEVYFDVAEITYHVDYYYESAEKLGTYPTKETKKYTTYAFTKVQVTDKPNTGFVINDAIRGTVKVSDSVVAGTRLKVYCDRIRSKVNVQYVSGRAGATYDCIFGIGLLNAPNDVFKDSTEYKVATYINGKKEKATLDRMKKVAGNTDVVFKLDGAGFDYATSNGVSTITNNSSERKLPCYTILNGSSNTIYLSATYTTTGSSSNKFGITLSNGETSRQVRFSNTGVTVMKDHTTASGILSTPKSEKTYAYASVYEDGGVYVWAQNSNAAGKTKVNSVIKNMVRNVHGGSYDICWAVTDGVLYARVEGKTVLRLPLTYLDKNWTADKKYEIGFSSYDASAWGDALQISNVKLALGKEAKNLLVTDKEVQSTLVKHIGYDAFTGEYLTGMKSKSAYLYGAETKENTGVSAKVTWADMSNTSSAAGITLKVGEKSIQYVIEGENAVIRSQDDHEWKNNTNLTKQIKKEVTPFSKEGVTQITAFVKDGYFYVMYNGVQAQCINMLSLFPEYTLETPTSVGICSWDPYNGQAKFADLKLLTAKDIEGIQTAKQWGFYSQALSVDEYSFADANIQKASKGEKAMTLLGANKAWQVEGRMNRLDDTKADLLMGFKVSVGDKSTLIMGRNNGFQVNWNTNPDYRKYADTASVYAMNNIASSKFFNKNNEETRTQDYIDFKTVIYNDILYVWFTDVDGNTGLGWRVPLTDEQFGGFKAGSDYKLALYMGSSDTQGSFTDLKVKMGYQVTGQSEFIKDQSGKVYAFNDAITAIDANVSKWKELTAKASLKDMFFEPLTGSYYGRVYEKVNSTNGKTSTIYCAATKDTQVLKVKMTPINKGGNTSLNGISVQSGNKSAQFYVQANNSNARLMFDHKWSGFSVASWIKTPFFTNEDVCNVTAVVKDSTLYIFYNNVLANSIDLYKVLPGYQEANGVQLGVCSYDAKNGLVLYSDIEYAKGAESIQGITLNDQNEWEIFTDKDGKITFTVNGEKITGTGVNMTADYRKREVTPIAGKSGAAYIYGVATNMPQMLTTNVTLQDFSGLNESSAYSGNGISVECNGQSVEFYIEGIKKYFRILEDGAWKSKKDNGFSAVAHDGVDGYEITAIVKNDTFYIKWNGNVAYRIALTKLFPGYKSGDLIRLGTATWDSKNGVSKFTDVNFKAGATVTIDNTNYKEIAGFQAQD